MIAVVIVVLLLALIGGAFVVNSALHTASTGGGGAPAGGAPAVVVQVTGVNYNFASTSGGAGCWNAYSGTGDTVDAGQSIPSSVSLTWKQPLFGSATCTVETVSVQTNGFSIVSSNVPLIVDTGQTQYLNLEIGTPSTSYTGVVSLSLTTSE